jgi:hypothetical protein
MPFYFNWVYRSRISWPNLPGTSGLRSIITDLGIRVAPRVFSGSLRDSSLTRKLRCAKYIDPSASWKLEQLSSLVGYHVDPEALSQRQG